MLFGAVAVTEAIGAILAHKILDANGKLLLNKGRILTKEDIEKLLAHHYEVVIVAQLEANDIHEDEAAERIGIALAGEGIRVRAPGVGRANLTALERGPLRINVPLLERLNDIHDGITVSTLREHTLVEPGDLVALVKIIPFGVPNARVADVERLAADATPIIRIRPLKKSKVGLIISGPEQGKDKLIGGFYPPALQRIERLGSELSAPIYVQHTAPALAKVIRENLAAHDLILIASISAIIDIEDVVPSALRLAGGSVTQHGVPVDPGTLLMLGYVDDVPIVGAPGCIKSPKTNVIDWILPRLLAGERLTRSDLVAMGHGGLLQDILERPMPRTKTHQDPVE